MATSKNKLVIGSKVLYKGMTHSVSGFDSRKTHVRIYQVYQATDAQIAEWTATEATRVAGGFAFAAGLVVAKKDISI